MDVFGCDYACRTVGESITKYNIPDDWCAEFDAHDGVYPIVCVQVNQIQKNPAMMALKLRVMEKADDAYAGCMVLNEKKTIAFKIDYMSDLAKTMENEKLKTAIIHKFVGLQVKIITFHRKTLLICWGRIDPINQECLLLQLKKFIALILPNRPYQQKFVAQTIQREKARKRLPRNQNWAASALLS